MSIIQEILFIVSNYPGGYKTIYDILYNSESPETTRERKRRENTVRKSLTRLKQQGLVKNTDGRWSLNQEGRGFLARSRSDIRRFFPPKKGGIKEEKKLIVTFDIPEKERKYRDWLRFELIAFGFEPIQKSVWFGPVLPEEFIEYISEHGLIRYIRFFKASEKDLI